MIKANDIAMSESDESYMDIEARVEALLRKVSPIVNNGNFHERYCSDLDSAKERYRQAENNLKGLLGEDYQQLQPAVESYVKRISFQDADEQIAASFIDPFMKAHEERQASLVKCGQLHSIVGAFDGIDEKTLKQNIMNWKMDIEDCRANSNTLSASLNSLKGNETEILNKKRECMKTLEDYRAKSEKLSLLLSMSEGLDIDALRTKVKDWKHELSDNIMLVNITDPGYQEAKSTVEYLMNYFLRHLHIKAKSLDVACKAYTPILENEGPEVAVDAFLDLFDAYRIASNQDAHIAQVESIAEIVDMLETKKTIPEAVNFAYRLKENLDNGLEFQEAFYNAKAYCSDLRKLVSKKDEDFGKYYIKYGVVENLFDEAKDCYVARHNAQLESSVQQASEKSDVDIHKLELGIMPRTDVRQPQFYIEFKGSVHDKPIECSASVSCVSALRVSDVIRDNLLAGCDDKELILAEIDRLFGFEKDKTSLVDYFGNLTDYCHAIDSGIGNRAIFNYQK